MKKKNRTTLIILLFALLCLVGALVIGERPRAETISETMKDAVLHESGKVSLFGLMEVNPAVISAMVVTAILLVLALIIRIFFLPRFTIVPGRFQLLIESWVGLFDNLAQTNSPHRNRFLGAYVFTAGSYIFVGTIMELFGFQVVTTHGVSMALSAPLADINGAICMGCATYLAILSGGIAGNGLKGVGLTLKDFSLPISMSFRLFGALMSGLLVTELVYYSIKISIVLPVVVGVLFTLIHALIQTYVLTFLASMFYGEVSEPPHGDKKSKAGRMKKVKKQAAA